MPVKDNALKLVQPNSQPDLQDRNQQKTQQLATRISETRKIEEDIRAATEGMLAEEMVEQSDVRSVAQSKVEAKEVAPERKLVLAIGDLDANSTALSTTLIEAGLFKKMPHKGDSWNDIISDLAHKATIVQTGDIFDRGSNAVKIMLFIQNLRKQGLDFVTVAGNHELLMIYAFNNVSVQNQSERFYAMVEKIIEDSPDTPGKMFEVLEEDYRKGDVEAEDAYLFLLWYYNGGRYTLFELMQKFFPEGDPTLMDVLNKGNELFIDHDGQFHDIVRSLKSMHQIDDVFYCHGGLDDDSAKFLEENGLEGVNTHFRQVITGPYIQPFLTGTYKDIFWRRLNSENSEVITPYAAEVLKKRGVRVIVRGHDTQPDGMQTVIEQHGLTIINNDIGIKNGNHGGVIISPNGEIVGFNKTGVCKKQVLAQLPPLSKPKNDHSRPANGVSAA